MPGKPRTRYAKALAGWLLYELEIQGPATMPELLDRIGYAHRDGLTRDQVAAINMAVRELVHGPVAVDPWTGALHYHRPGARVPWSAREAT